tara:strand:- start:210 stop:1112 length:903 start_codon:yes stop_codon:yes gene_type:complete
VATDNNLLDEPTVGGDSGTWGGDLNENWQRVDQALSGLLTITLPNTGSTGTPNDVPIAAVDSGSSQGRNIYLDFDDGGDLGATAYVRLTPDSVSKVAYIRNSLAGSREIRVFQGTYSDSRDFHLPAGHDAILKFSGGGATGSTVESVLLKMSLPAMAVDTISEITAAAGVTVDGLLIKDGVATGHAQLATTNAMAQTNTFAKGIRENRSTSTSTPLALTVENGQIQHWTLPSNPSVLTDSLVSGDSVKLTIPATSHTVTWTAIDEWIGTAEPSLSASKNNHIEVWKEGTVCFASYIGFSS